MYGWQRYYYIEQEFVAVRQYLPYEFKNVYSEFFTRSITVLGAEIEGAFKELCKILGNPDAGNISQYKETILTKYPNIVSWKCSVKEELYEIIPFEKWDKESLDWWGIYTRIKHNLVDRNARYKVALKMLGAYELLIYTIAATDPNNRILDTYGNEKPIKAYSYLDSPRVMEADLNFVIGSIEDDVTMIAFYPNEVLKRIM